MFDYHDSASCTERLERLEERYKNLPPLSDECAKLACEIQELKNALEGKYLITEMTEDELQEEKKSLNEMYSKLSRMHRSSERDLEKRETILERMNRIDDEMTQRYRAEYSRSPKGLGEEEAPRLKPGIFTDADFKNEDEPEERPFSRVETEKFNELVEYVEKLYREYYSAAKAYGKTRELYGIDVVPIIPNLYSYSSRNREYYDSFHFYLSGTEVYHREWADREWQLVSTDLSLTKMAKVFLNTILKFNKDYVSESRDTGKLVHDLSEAFFEKRLPVNDMEAIIKNYYLELLDIPDDFWYRYYL